MVTDAELIEKHEGRRLKKYRDSLGYWTEGVGHKMRPGDPDTLTPAQCDAQFTHDLADMKHQLDLQLPWWRTLDPIHQCVIEDMAFELGVAGLLKFKTFLACMQRKDYPAARQAMLASLWAKQVPNRAHDDAELVDDQEDAGTDPFLRAS